MSWMTWWVLSLNNFKDSILSKLSQGHDESISVIITHLEDRKTEKFSLIVLHCIKSPQVNQLTMKLDTVGIQQSPN